jgi:hypothetical protein
LGIYQVGNVQGRKGLHGNELQVLLVPQSIHPKVAVLHEFLDEMVEAVDP